MESRKKNQRTLALVLSGTHLKSSFLHCVKRVSVENLSRPEKHLTFLFSKLPFNLTVIKEVGQTKKIVSPLPFSSSVFIDDFNILTFIFASAGLLSQYKTVAWTRKPCFKVYDIIKGFGTKGGESTIITRLRVVAALAFALFFSKWIP